MALAKIGAAERVFSWCAEAVVRPAVTASFSNQPRPEITHRKTSWRLTLVLLLKTALLRRSAPWSSGATSTALFATQLVEMVMVCLGLGSAVEIRRQKEECSSVSRRFSALRLRACLRACFFAPNERLRPGVSEVGAQGLEPTGPEGFRADLLGAKVPDEGDLLFFQHLRRMLTKTSTAWEGAVHRAEGRLEGALC